MSDTDSQEVGVVRDSVFEFVAEHVGVSVSKLRDETTLLGDLGVDGDDGHELLRDFSKRFGVNVAKLRLDEHFGSEGVPPWAPFYWLLLAFRKGSPEQRARLKPISMSFLVEVAVDGHWPSVGE